MTSLGEFMSNETTAPPIPHPWLCQLSLSLILSFQSQPTHFSTDFATPGILSFFFFSITVNSCSWETCSDYLISTWTRSIVFKVSFLSLVFSLHEILAFVCPPPPLCTWTRKYSSSTCTLLTYSCMAFQVLVIVYKFLHISAFLRQAMIYLNGLFGVTAVKCKVSFQEIGIIFTNQSWSN